MLANPAPPAAAISPTSAAAAQLPARTADVPPAADPASAAAVVAGPDPAVDASRIVLHANADAWLMVKERSGVTLLNRTLKAGETWPVPPRPDLLLTTGNAGGTEIVVDGAPMPSLSGNGAVRRDLPLDPDQIKDGKLTAAAGTSITSSVVLTRPR